MPIIREAPAALAPSATCQIYGNKEIDAIRQRNNLADKNKKKINMKGAELYF